MEKITSTTIFKAFDGKIFESQKECEEYEKTRKDFLSKIKFFSVLYSPDLTETGLFCNAMLVAVYSEYYLHKEIITQYCIYKFGYLGKSVQGYRFQKYFNLDESNFEEFNKGRIAIRSYEQGVKKLILSPIELEEFKGIERFDYMKEWGFK